MQNCMAMDSTTDRCQEIGDPLLCPKHRDSLPVLNMSFSAMEHQLFWVQRFSALAHRQGLNITDLVDIQILPRIESELERMHKYLWDSVPVVKWDTYVLKSGTSLYRVDSNETPKTLTTKTWFLNDLIGFEDILPWKLTQAGMYVDDYLKTHTVSEYKLCEDVQLIHLDPDYSYIDVESYISKHVDTEYRSSFSFDLDDGDNGVLAGFLDRTNIESGYFEESALSGNDNPVETLLTANTVLSSVAYIGEIDIANYIDLDFVDYKYKIFSGQSVLI